MKNFFLIAVSFFAGIVFRHFIQIEKVRSLAAQSRVSSEMTNREHSPKPIAPAAFTPPPARPGRTWTFVPGLGRYIEHDSNVSAMRSIGGG